MVQANGDILLLESGFEPGLESGLESRTRSKNAKICGELPLPNVFIS